MTAILRIRSVDHSPSLVAAAPGPGDAAKAYLDRLVKLVPAEVVGLYLAGKSAIQAVYPAADANHPLDPAGHAYWLGWTLFCLVAVVVVRAWATSDGKTNTPVEWPAVVIATVSYLVWVYSMGDAFAQFGHLWQPLLASLMVFAWTFAAPLLYRDPATPASAPDAERHDTPAADQVLAANLSRNTNFSARLPGALGGQPPFSQADAEQAVLKAAKNKSGETPNLSDTVSDHFGDASQVRDVLAETQDVIANDNGIWVDLASGPDSEMDDHGKGSYQELSIWVHGQVTARKAPRAAL